MIGAQCAGSGTWHWASPVKTCWYGDQAKSIQLLDRMGNVPVEVHNTAPFPEHFLVMKSEPTSFPA